MERKGRVDMKFVDIKKEWRFSGIELKRDRDCRKSTGNKLGYWYICMTLCACAITVLHEQWMYLSKEKHPHHR